MSEALAKTGGISSNLLKSTVCCSANFMSSLYISDVRPASDSASLVWNLGYAGNTKLLEVVQHRWTKQITRSENLPYSDRLTRLSLDSVNGRLLRYDLIHCYPLF